MAYHRRNFLKKVIRVQAIVLMHRKQGLFYKEIYHQYIEHEFNISKRTFDSYLGIPAKKELKELEAGAQTSQLTLDFNNHINKIPH